MVRTSSSVLAIASLAALAVSGTAVAKTKKPRKAKPACDLGYLPFTPGAHWTYAFFTPAEAPDRQGVFVKDPDSFTVKVTGIRQDGDDTVIALEESYRKRVVATELRCGKNGIAVPIDSFYFFGEPGGGIGLTLGDLARKETTGLEFPAKKLVAGTELYEEITARTARTPAEGSGAMLSPGTLEVERKLTVGGAEDVDSKLTTHSTTRVDIELTGRANLEGQPAEKAFNMPGARATLWFAPGTGVVRVENTQGKGWMLAEFSDGSEPDAAAPPPTPTP